MSDNTTIPMTPAGPVSEAYIRSKLPVKALMGPTGSGKTISTFQAVIFAACQFVRPGPDGVRRLKAGFLSKTYSSAKTKLIPSYKQWLPPTMAGSDLKGDGPILGEIRLDVPGIGKVDIEIEFLAIGDNRAEDILRGWEGNILWLNEADLFDEDVLDLAINRVGDGRYPAPHLRPKGEVFGTVLLDFNAPSIDHWIFRRFIEEKPDDFGLFVQPGGLDPAAENITPQRLAHYQRQARIWAKSAPDKLQRLINNKFAFSRRGKPVHPEYNDGLMVARASLIPVSEFGLILGIDGGGTPALTVRQMFPDGQWWCLAELISPHDENTGPERFGRNLNRLLAERFPGWPRRRIRGYADPATMYGADKKGGQLDWLQKLAKETQLDLQPAYHNNDPIKRRGALRASLAPLDDGRPGTLFDPSVRTLRAGYSGKFHFEKSGDDWALAPVKNKWSHVCEADEYGVLGGSRFGDLADRAATGSRNGGGPIIASSDFQVR